MENFILDWLLINFRKYPNVIGFSKQLVDPEVDGEFLENAGKSLRFYVSKKVDIDDLIPREIIPEILSIKHLLKTYNFETDVVEIGEQYASPPIPLDRPISEIDKTVNFRPVELGVSVGNEAITAGSLGMLYEVLEDNPNYGVIKGDTLAGTNGHVVAPNPAYSVEEVGISRKLNILQRGKYHGGSVPFDTVGKYVWHEKLYGIDYEAPTPSLCNVANNVAGTLNKFASVLGRDSRLLTTSLDIPNTIDFGLYKPSVEHVMKIADDSIDLSLQFGGHLFAGSVISGSICQISEILNRCPIKIKPKVNNYADLKYKDIAKGCSFWCNYYNKVIDDDAVLDVIYDGNKAPFQKIAVVRNEEVIKGGWSGSGWFKL